MINGLPGLVNFIVERGLFYKCVQFMFIECWPWLGQTMNIYTLIYQTVATTKLFFTNLFIWAAADFRIFFVCDNLSYNTSHKSLDFISCSCQILPTYFIVCKITHMHTYPGNYLLYLLLLLDIQILCCCVLPVAGSSKQWQDWEWLSGSVQDGGSGGRVLVWDPVHFVAYCSATLPHHPILVPGLLYLTLLLLLLTFLPFC